MTPEEFYRASNLTGNPFRSNPTHASDPRINIWVGYERQQQQLLRILIRTRADQVGNTNLVMLYGTYGTGKSHALFWAQNRILNVEPSIFRAVCYFIPRLKKAKGQLTFAGAFEDDLVNKSRLISDILGFKAFLGSCIYRYRDEAQISPTSSDESVIDLLIPEVELSGFAKRIFNCDSEEEIKGFLCPKGLTDYQAVTIFTQIVNLFVLEFNVPSGFRRYKYAAYLFIDELDDLLRTNTKEARLVNDTLRQLYDACPNCFCMIIALSAEAAEFTAIFEDYILSRIQRRIELHLLDKDDALRFVIEILDQSRIDTSGQTGPFPFEMAALEIVIAQLVEITPRKIVNTMQEVIEEARLEGCDPTESPIRMDQLDDIIVEVFGDGGVV